MKRIIVSVTNDLATDQRVHKICTTLLHQNFEVLLIGRKFKNSKPLNRAYKTYRMRLLFNKGFLFYAEYNMRLFLKLIVLKKKVLLANDLDTLPANYLAALLTNKPIVYDSHELFTEVPELINKPFQKQFWLKIEQFILPKLQNCYTVSNSIALYYQKKYNTPFTVVRNVPLTSTHLKIGSLPFKTSGKKIILYQGVLNKGRGLSLIIDAMQYINDALFVMIGDGDIKNILKQKVASLNLEKKVVFVPKMLPNDLKKITPLANIGLSVEEDLGLNYRYALPNKLFDYIQAKVPVLVSNLPEMEHIVATYHVGEALTSRQAKKVAEQIKRIIFSDTDSYKESLQEAAKKLCWEKEELKIIKLFKSLK